MIVLVTIIIIALCFEFINGFHDISNVVATPIATKAMSPYQAIILASIFNFAGAFFGTAVATTISKGLVDANAVTHLVLIAALISAISWNLLTWFFGIPSSSSHALIGSLVGAALAVSGMQDIHFNTLIDKVIIPMVMSPVIAFAIALFLVVLILKIVSRHNKPRRTNKYIREFQVFSSSLMAFSHGSNDAQKTMSIITLALFGFGVLDNLGAIPTWVIVVCATTMALGSLSGGFKIIKTLSTRVAKIQPINGLAAELSSGFLILGASHLGFPISTTQAAAGSIMGAGYADRKGINPGVVKAIAVSWLLTLPCCMVMSYGLFWLLHTLLGSTTL